MRRFRIPSRFHGFFDYALGFLLVLLPFLLGLGTGVAGLALLFGGLVLLAVALTTDYEMGLLRRLQLPVHLWIDGILGLLLTLSPWLFVFYQTVWFPHLLAGIALIIAAFITETVPGYERRGSLASEPEI